jgi:DNA-directed RNA polymerase specialized sigma subunit
MTPEEVRAIPDPAERFRAAQADMFTPLAKIRKLNKIKREVCRDLHDQGLTWEQVGERLGISRQRAQQLGQPRAKA